MKKVVCLHNVYHDGRFITAGTDVGLPDDVARNWVERGLAKFVGEETPVNPPAVPPVEKPEVKPEEKAVVEFVKDETPVSPNENAAATPVTASAENPVADVDTPKRGRPPKKKHGGKRK